MPVYYRNKITGEIITEEEFNRRKAAGLIQAKATTTPTTQTVAPAAQTYAPATQTHQPTSIYQKVTGALAGIGRFFGMEPFGKGIALTLARLPGVGRLLAPEVRELEEKVTKGTATPEELEAYYEIFAKEAPTTRQILGSAMQTAMLPVSLAMPTPQTFGQAALTGAGIGVGYGIARGVEGEKRIKEIGQEAAIGAFIGGLAGAFTYALSKGLEKVGRRLYEGLVRYSRDPQKASKALIDREVVGTANTIKKRIDNEIEIYERMLQNQLKTQPERVITQDQIIKESLEQLRSATRPELRRFVNEGAFKENLQEGLKRLGLDIGRKKLNLAEVNALRREIDRKLGDRAFQKMFEELPQQKAALMILRRGLENIVKTAVPETEGIFASYAPLVEASKALAQTIHRVSKRAPLEGLGLLAGSIGGFFYPKAWLGVGTYWGLRSGVQSGLIPTILGKTALTASDIARLATTPEGQVFLQNLFSKLFK